jgi:ribonucleoside-diphosphate reductase alpha chain
MCQTVSSAGGRRGAQMATLDIHHPDVESFIKAKREDGRLRQFNLSVLITDAFIDAVNCDGDWKLSFPIMKQETHDDSFDIDEHIVWRRFPVKDDNYIINDVGLTACKVYKTLKAKALWDAIMDSTYNYAEPGFILIDHVNDMNNNWWSEQIMATNP